MIPLMSEEEFQELKANIAEHGVRDFVTFWKGQLVDGRHRVRAMQELGIDVACHSSELFDDDDPIAFTISVNLKRRNLTESQRKITASKLATLLQGDNQQTKEDVQNCTSSSTTQPLRRAMFRVLVEWENTGKRPGAECWQSDTRHKRPELVDAIRREWYREIGKEDLIFPWHDDYVLSCWVDLQNLERSEKQQMCDWLNIEVPEAWKASQ